MCTALVAGLALVLAGCADPGPAGGSGGPAGTGPSDGGPGTVGDQLAGRTFLSTSVDGHELVDGSVVRLTVESDRITANAGCNTLSGSYRLADGRITVQNMGGTEMGCDRPLMDQDGWLADWLGSGLDVTVDRDRLTLAGGGVRMQLADRRVVDPDRPLVGTTWRLDGIVSGSGPSASVSSVPQGITATLRVADDRIDFFDGLNSYQGPEGPDARLVIEADTVRVRGDFAGSSAGCASGHTCSVDMSLLTRDFGYSISAGRLTVTGTGPMADRGLVFLAGEPAQGTPPGATPGPTTPPESPAVPPGSSGSGGPSPAEPGPVGSPGTLSAPTTGGGPLSSPPGRHDSIPPQPTPRSANQPDG